MRQVDHKALHGGRVRVCGDVRVQARCERGHAQHALAHAQDRAPEGHLVALRLVHVRVHLQQRRHQPRTAHGVVLQHRLHIRSLVGAASAAVAVVVVRHERVEALDKLGPQERGLEVAAAREQAHNELEDGVERLGQEAVAALCRLPEEVAEVLQHHSRHHCNLWR